MPQRKVWSEQQDKILKFLKQQRGEHKWSVIAKIMQQQFGIVGRTGKQCRQRYHNHLDMNIITTEWSIDQEEILIRMHEEYGNKWSLIAQQLQGRSDNYVKNHFYSKLRKSIRRLNKIIVEYFENDYHQIQEKILSKIIEIQETRFNVSSKVDEELAQFCNGIKNRLLKFDIASEELSEDLLQQSRRLIIDIQIFQNNYKKGYKAIAKNEYELQSKGYLLPPSSTKRRNSVSSNRSQDSFLSSSSYISSCSDLSQYDQMCSDRDNKKSKTTNSRKGSTNSRNSRKGSGLEIETGKNEKIEEDCQKKQAQPFQKLVHYPQTVHNLVKSQEMVVEQFQDRHKDLIQQDSCNNQECHVNPIQQYFDNIIYDNTIFTARILAPSLNNPSFPEFHLLNPSDNQDFIEYREQRDNSQ